jgi:hypothetical protein
LTRSAATKENLVDALDGNEIAAEMYELFGREMTTVTGACVHCGASAQIAELAVYNRAPGTVVRCRSCGDVVFVLLNIRGIRTIDLDGFTLPGSLRPRPVPDQAQPTS